MNICNLPSAQYGNLDFHSNTAYF